MLGFWSVRARRSSGQVRAHPPRIHPRRKDSPDMTTASHEHARAERATGPSIHVVRARKLLYGGLVGGLTAALICLLVFGIVAGPKGLVSAALGAGMVLFFYVAGQLVMVAFA